MEGDQGKCPKRVPPNYSEVQLGLDHRYDTRFLPTSVALLVFKGGRTGHELFLCEDREESGNNGVRSIRSSSLPTDCWLTQTAAF